MIENSIQKKVILGLDTSNYKTSVALSTIDGKVIGDERKLLFVKHGERGLRQSDALFQHVENLPIVIEKLFQNQTNYEICSVCASTRPRNIEGSYMPCFKAGTSMGQSMASMLKVPFYQTSHQEGHLMAITNTLDNCPTDFLALHLSGGTCELLKVHTTPLGFDIEIIGGSKDISYGQVIDRIGVALGMEFPSGAFMDEIAIRQAKAFPNDKAKKQTLSMLKPIKVDGTYINLSGIETQAQRIIAEKHSQNSSISVALCEFLEQSNINENGCTNINANMEMLILEVFDKISISICKIIENALASANNHLTEYKSEKLNTVIFVGGVSSSKYISEKLTHFANQNGYRFEFGNQEYSSDNATGVALIGGKIYGNKTDQGFTTK